MMGLAKGEESCSRMTLGCGDCAHATTVTLVPMPSFGAKHGSYTPSLAMHRHASFSSGSAIEAVKHDPPESIEATWMFGFSFSRPLGTHGS